MHASTRAHAAAMRVRLVSSLTLGLCLSAAAAWAVIARGAEFRAGVAAVDITPPRLPVRVAGNLTETWADRVYDPLHVRALVLDDGATRLAVVVVDSCMMDREMLDDAKAAASRTTGIPAAHMLVAATHTHSAPAVMGCHGTEPHPDYRAWLTTRITEAIVRADRNRAPARVGWGKANCPEFVHCRRWLMKPGGALTPPFTGHATNRVQMNPGHDNPNKLFQTGPVDPAVTVLALQTRAGKPLALLANYSTHYAGAPGVSADYFGEFCREMAKRLGAEPAEPGFVALMSNGTSGDANCMDFSQPARSFDRFTVARAVADAASEACRRLEYHDWAPLAAVERRLTLGVRLPSRQEVAAARAYLVAHVGDRPIRNWEENYARETVLLATWPARKELKLQALRIGELGIGGVPCEVFGSTGLELKKHSPFALSMILGLANGYHGYLPPPEQHALGGYTTWRARTSYLEVGAEPIVVRELGALLRQVNARR